MKFNEKLSYLRKKNNMTQEDLASILNISRQSVSKWENGETEPEVSKIKIIAKIFDVSFNYLLNDEIENEDVVKTDDETNNLEDTKVDETEKVDASMLQCKYDYTIWTFVTLISVVVLIISLIVSSLLEPVSSVRMGLIGFWMYNWFFEAILLKILTILSLSFIVIGISRIVKITEDRSNKMIK